MYIEQNQPQQIITFHLKYIWDLADIENWKERIIQLRNAIQTKRENIKFSKGLNNLLISYRLDIDLDEGFELGINQISNPQIKLNSERYLIVTLDIISLYPFTHIQVFQKTTKKGGVYIPKEYKPVFKKTDFITITSTLKQVAEIQDSFNYKFFKINQLNISQVCGKLIAEQVRFNAFELFEQDKKQQIQFQKMHVSTIIGQINQLMGQIPRNWQNYSKARGQQILKQILPPYSKKVQSQQQQQKIKQKKTMFDLLLSNAKKNKGKNQNQVYQKLVQPLLEQFFKYAIQPIDIPNQNIVIMVMYVQKFITAIEYHEVFGKLFQP